MTRVFSKTQPGTLIGIIFRASDFKDGRCDIAPVNEFLQCSALNFNYSKTFRPHKHISLEKTTNITQECWVVIQGKVFVKWYDLNDVVLKEFELEAGDMAMTFRGGHNYIILEDDTKVYEFKTGPYWGVDQDKVFI